VPVETLGELGDTLVAPAVGLIKDPYGSILLFELGEFVAALIDPIEVVIKSFLCGLQRPFGLTVTPSSPGSESGKSAGGFHLASPVVDPRLCSFEVFGGGGQGLVGLGQPSGDIEGPASQDGLMGVAFLFEPDCDPIGVVEGGEGLGRLPVQGRLHFFGRGVGGVNDMAAMVAGIDGSGVPGVGSLDGPRLSNIAPVTIKRCGAEKMNLGPSAALHTVDGSTPRM
jgi:hypothetical protein